MSRQATQTSTQSYAVATSPDADSEKTGLTRNRRPSESSPYLAARSEWDERYGSLITRARNWRLAAFLALAVALVATCGLIALSMKAKVIPYVVAIDNLGRVLAAGPAEQASRADDRLKRAALFQ